MRALQGSALVIAMRLVITAGLGASDYDGPSCTSGQTFGFTARQVRLPGLPPTQALAITLELCSSDCTGYDDHFRGWLERVRWS